MVNYANYVIICPFKLREVRIIFALLRIMTQYFC